MKLTRRTSAFANFLERFSDFSKYGLHFFQFPDFFIFKFFSQCFFFGWFYTGSLLPTDKLSIHHGYRLCIPHRNRLSIPHRHRLPIHRHRFPTPHRHRLSAPYKHRLSIPHLVRACGSICFSCFFRYFFIFWFTLIAKLFLAQAFYVRQTQAVYSARHRHLYRLYSPQTQALYSPLAKALYSPQAHAKQVDGRSR